MILALLMASVVDPVELPFGTYHVDAAPKPYVYPLLGPGDLPMTRGYPMDPQANEASDHPHHVSLWFAHGNVNGVDFWHATGETRIAYESHASNTDSVSSVHHWRSGEDVLLREDRTMHSTSTEDRRELDIDITLTASQTVTFGDTKEGTFALRLHPALRLKGKVATGNILTSAGFTDGDAWGKRAAWVVYQGVIDERDVSVAVFDHPENPRHPTWWHARDYGLLAANPFGKADFEGTPRGEGRMTVEQGDSIRFRYAVNMYAGHVTSSRLLDDYDAWASRLSLSSFEMTDDSAWEIVDGALALTGKSEYSPPFRSPHNIALLKGSERDAFTLDVEAMQTGREYGHRDLCLFFGYQSPSQFYYVHLATTPDQNANNIFIVNEAARTPLAPVPEHGTDWGTEVWRKLRLERTSDGDIRVYVDGALKLEANDTTFGAGRIGFGSFDDTGRFRAIRLRP